MPRTSALLTLLIRFSLCFACVYGYVEHVSSARFRVLTAGLHGGQFGFLTVLGCIATILTLVLAAVDDAIERLSRTSSTSQRCLDVRYAMLAVTLPVELLITILFWSFLLYDRTLLVQVDHPAQQYAHILASYACLGCRQTGWLASWCTSFRC